MLARSAVRRFSQTLSRSNQPILSKIVTKTPCHLNLLNNGVKSRSLCTTKICLTDVTNQNVHEKIDSMVKDADVVVFMKGVPAAPRCGFSNAVCQIMRMHDVPFVGHNILLDEEVRTGKK